MDITQVPCPICGKTNYSLGRLTSKSKLFFTPKPEGGIINRLLNLNAEVRSIHTARQCLDCGHIALFVGWPENRT